MKSYQENVKRTREVGSRFACLLGKIELVLMREADSLRSQVRLLTCFFKHTSSNIRSNGKVLISKDMCLLTSQQKVPKINALLLLWTRSSASIFCI